MKKRVKRSLLLALAVLLASYGVSFSDHINETIWYGYYCPEDTHTYNYASTLDFCKGDDPDDCHEGIKIGTNPVWPDTLFWSHTLPPGFLVPPYVITRAKLWIDGHAVNSENDTVCIQGTCDWEPLNHISFDSATYDLSGVSAEGFWNQGSIDVVVRAGESLVRLDHAKLLLDYTQDTTKPVLTCAGDELTCDSTMASATVISDPSVGVSYFWDPEPVSGQGTDHARYDAPGIKEVVVTILATGCKDSCEAVIFGEPTDVEEEESSSPIGGFYLSQNYPNPFNPETEISFFLSERASVSLVVYNVFGQKVKGLISVILPAGSYKVAWDGTDDQGNRLASGVYFCRLSAGENTSTSKMVLMK